MHETGGLKGFLLRTAPRIPYGPQLLGWFYRRFMVSKFTLGSYAAVCRITDQGERQILLVESWDGGLLLPGGGVDARKDASLRDAAIRELEEETGIVASWLTPDPVATVKRGHYCGVVFLVRGKVTQEPRISSECVGFEWYTLKDVFDLEKSKAIKGGMGSVMWHLIKRSLLAYLFETQDQKPATG